MELLKTRYLIDLMRVTTMPLRLVEVEGDYRRRGLQFGEKCRDEIKRTLANNYDIIEYTCGLSREKALMRARSIIPNVTEIAPDLCEEIQGISDGSSTSFEDIFILNAIPEMMRMPFGGCTVISIGEQLTENGKRITAQTVDWNPMLEDQYVVLKATPEKGPTILTYTMAGLLALVGINSKGIGSFINIFLTKENITQGMPSYFILRRILEQDRVSGAISSVILQKRASPFCYTISDSDGDLYCVEALVDDYEILGEEEGVFVHTNHILTERLRGKDIYVNVSRNPETLTRFYRVRMLLNQVLTRKTTLGIEDLKRVLADHANYPDSICRHQNEEITSIEARFKTLAAIINEQGEKNILVNSGNPCQNSYIDYRLD